MLLCYVSLSCLLFKSNWHKKVYQNYNHHLIWEKIFKIIYISIKILSWYVKSAAQHFINVTVRLQVHRINNNDTFLSLSMDATCGNGINCFSPLYSYWFHLINVPDSVRHTLTPLHPPLSPLSSPSCGLTKFIFNMSIPASLCMTVNRKINIPETHRPFNLRRLFLKIIHNFT